MNQYTDNGKLILTNGKMVKNQRTGTNCLTYINLDFKYQVGDYATFPIVTTRKSYYKQAIGEMLAYIRGYHRLEDFHKLGVKTWDANVQSSAWKKNPNYQEDSIGLCYGALSNRLEKVERLDNGKYQTQINDDIENNQLYQIALKLRQKEDDRRLIWSFWNPSFHDHGCLAPCMYEHQFSLIGDDLYLNSNQRSCDYPLGGNFNIMQSWFLLWVMSKVTDLKPKFVHHRMVNAHVYENQLSLFEMEMKRKPIPGPRLIYQGKHPITLERLFDLPNGDIPPLHPDEFTLDHYRYMEAIAYPFTA